MIVQVGLFCGQCIWCCLFNVICFLVVLNPITIDVCLLMPLDSKVRVWWHFVTASICTKEI